MPLTRRTTLARLAALPALPTMSALSALSALPASPAVAAARRYTLDPFESKVTFQFTLSGVPQRGEIPILRADIQLDTAQLTASTVTVELDAQGAETALPFARDALRSEQLLAVDRWPRIRFESQKITLGPDGRISGGASITGALTLRGVTRPITLAAALYRVPGSAADDLKRLSAQLSGSLSRKAFGAVGYPQLVGDQVMLDIKARIRAG